MAKGFNQEVNFIIPDEYQYIRNDINQVKENLRAIDQHMLIAVDDPVNPPQRLNYNPPGAFSVYKPQTKEQKVDKLKNEKEHVKSEAWLRTEKALKDADPEMAFNIQNSVRDSLSDYSDKNAKELKAIEHDPRSIVNAQDYMTAGQRFSKTLMYTQQQDSANNPNIEKSSPGIKKNPTEPNKS